MCTNFLGRDALQITCIEIDYTLEKTPASDKNNIRITWDSH